MPRVYGWNRSVQAQERLQDRIVNGYYSGRRLITRDSRINGGVYIGAHEREAIVVDSRKYSGIKKVMREVARLYHAEKRLGAIDIVYSVVRRTMRYDIAACDSLIAKVTSRRPDQKMILDHFIEERVGVCRHMALLAGVIIELLGESGIVRGKASIDRNESIDTGHVWCRYTRRDGSVYIIDCAAEYMGPLPSSPLKWDYRRLGEK